MTRELFFSLMCYANITGYCQYTYQKGKVSMCPFRLQYPFHIFLCNVLCSIQLSWAVSKVSMEWEVKDKFCDVLDRYVGPSNSTA